VGAAQLSLFIDYQGNAAGNHGPSMTRTKISVLAFAAALLAGVGGYGLYRLGLHQGAVASTETAPGASGAQASVSRLDPSTGRKVLYWHDPMVPAQRFNKPGKSPFMDMQLLPVYADETNNAGGISVSPAQQQNLGIRTAEVKRGNLGTAVEVVGNVAWNERDVAVVQARSNGYIERLYVRAPLDPVRKGQALAELYVPDWVAAQEEYLSVKRMGDGIGTMGLLDAARQRMRLAGMSDDQIHLVESSGKAHPRLSVTALIGGVISELSAREGMTVMNGAPLFRINGLRTVWVNAELPENLAALVRPGNVVQARTPALPGKTFAGKIGAILPEISAATRTITARIELANPSGELVPGMFATVSLRPAASADVLLVPSEAVIRTGKRNIVIVEQANGQFSQVEVDLGAEGNGQTEVRKGLEAGQKVVASGQFLIDSEASLKGTEARMGDTRTPTSSAAPASPALEPTHHGVGKIESIGKDDITISHGPIQSLHWGAMTMGFMPPKTGLPKNIRVGDTVAFDIRATPDGMYQIVQIAPATNGLGAAK
jgi:Cu(I)/Ag(I) efflux system membrane fusion protein